ncbi:MAG: hypothetical protein ACLQQB_12955 [Solirubrobacteraceae bacterium]|jgi:hypothetical protein
MDPGRTVISGRSRQLGQLLPVLLSVGALAGCGSGSTSATHSTAAVAVTTPASASCATTVAGALGTVAGRIYHEAATGGDVAQAVHRMQTSTALATAINAGEATAAQSALRELLLGQIVRVEVLRGGHGHVFAQAGSGAAIAPVRGSIPGTNATYVLSTQSDRSYLEVVHQVTGAQALLTTGSAGGARRLAGTIAGPPPASPPAAGPVTYAGRRYQTAVLTGAVYPAGELHIVLLVPSTTISCPGSAAQARVEALGHVGERIYQEELHSPDVAATVRHIESSVPFGQAVAAHDATGARAAIVEFFRQHIHVVRVRVSTSAGVLVDVGGPYVLAPVPGTVRSNGQVVGRFAMAIQDDAGYLKLAHLFTGAEVLMRTGERQVMGTLSPGPGTVPDRGPVSYEGHTYQAYSFIGEAFPSGPLRISLLLAS